ncbi:MAG TPA: hypothetical protein DCE43_13985 [Planctomycetaceae bacterium]|nr:hypothetical protein [Planctomycetaceae bacterium]|tara:strand:+ start:578 stop:1600 length:1023 start_codon:yes stop_codon:yes gene_type:complete
MLFTLLDRLKGALFRFIRARGVVLCVRRVQWDNREMNQSYTQVSYQILCDDVVRNSAYEKVVEKVVAGKRVVDIGTGGMAFLARMCVEAGAEKVYAIEENTASFRSAQQRVRQAGLESRIELQEGFSTDVELAEKCDVLVHEVVGSVGSAEGMTLVVNDAKERFLKDDAEFIPHSCSTFVCPVKPLKLSMLDAMVSAISQFLFPFDHPDLYKVFNFPESNLLGPPAQFEKTVFCEEMPLEDRRELELVISKDGELDGLLLFIEIHVDRETVVNSLRQRTNWSTPYIKLFKEPVKVSRGDVVHVTVHRELSTTQPRYELDVRVCPRASGVETTRCFEWRGN